MVTIAETIAKTAETLAVYAAAHEAFPELLETPIVSPCLSSAVLSRRSFSLRVNSSRTIFKNRLYFST